MECCLRTARNPGWPVPCFALLVVASACPGCLLIIIPYGRELPGEVHGIRVVDADSGKDIEDAVLVYRVAEYQNWLLPPRSSVENPAQDTVPLPPSAACQSVKRGADGVFRVEPAKRVAWARIAGPTPLGWVLYHDYQAIIDASAPGHWPLRVYCGVGVDFTPGLLRADSVNGAVRWYPNGDLAFRLRCRTEAPASG